MMISKATNTTMKRRKRRTTARPGSTSTSSPLFHLLVPLLVLLAGTGGGLCLPTEPLLHQRQWDQDLGNDTQNGLLQGRCTALTVLFARGTLESGNVGSFAGPPFFQALAARVGSDRLNVQGVDYAAVSQGFFSGGDSAGSLSMAQLAVQAVQTCPGTKVVLSGYSQGGQLVHNAARVLGPQGIGVISAAVTFGDPYNPAPVPGLPLNNSMIFCHMGDDICKGGEQLFDPHFTYNRDAGAAADFVVRITKLDGPPGGGNGGPLLPFPSPFSLPVRTAGPTLEGEGEDREDGKDGSERGG